MHALTCTPQARPSIPSTRNPLWRAYPIMRELLFARTMMCALDPSNAQTDCARAFWRVYLPWHAYLLARATLCMCILSRVEASSSNDLLSPTTWNYEHQPSSPILCNHPAQRRCSEEVN